MSVGNKNVTTSHKQDWTHQVVSWYIESDFLLSLGHVRRLRRPIEQVQNTRFVVPRHLGRQLVRALDRLRENRDFSRATLASASQDRAKLLPKQRTTSLCI